LQKFKNVLREIVDYLRGLKIAVTACCNKAISLVDWHIQKTVTTPNYAKIKEGNQTEREEREEQKKERKEKEEKERIEREAKEKLEREEKERKEREEKERLEREEKERKERELNERIEILIREGQQSNELRKSNIIMIVNATTQHIKVKLAPNPAEILLLKVSLGSTVGPSSVGINGEAQGACLTKWAWEQQIQKQSIFPAERGIFEVDKKKYYLTISVNGDVKVENLLLLRQKKFTVTKSHLQ